MKTYRVHINEEFTVEAEDEIEARQKAADFINQILDPKNIEVIEE